MAQGEEVLVFHYILYGEGCPLWRAFPLRSVVAGLCVCHRWPTVVEVPDSGGSAETAAVQTRLGHPIVVLPPVGLPLAARVVACELL